MCIGDKAAWVSLSLGTDVQNDAQARASRVDCEAVHAPRVQAV